jgi:hypothetical protein
MRFPIGIIFIHSLAVTVGVGRRARCRRDVGGEGVGGLNVARNGSFPFRVATAPRSSLRPP